MFTLDSAVWTSPPFSGRLIREELGARAAETLGVLRRGAYPDYEAADNRNVRLSRPTACRSSVVSGDPDSMEPLQVHGEADDVPLAACLRYATKPVYELVRVDSHPTERHRQREPLPVAT